MEIQGMEQCTMGQGDTPPQFGEHAPASDGFDHLDFQARQWKCPGCQTINSFGVLACPGCGTSAIAIMDKITGQQKKKLSQVRDRKSVSAKTAFNLFIAAGLVLAALLSGSFILMGSLLIIYSSPALLAFTIIFCLLHPKKKNKKKAAKESMAHLQSGLIELAAIIEEQVGL